MECRKRRSYDDLWDADEDSHSHRSKQIKSDGRQERESGRREKQQDRRSSYKESDKRRMENEYKRHGDRSHGGFSSSNSSTQEREARAEAQKSVVSQDDYVQRVDEQMKTLVEVDEEEELRKRRERRKAILDKYKSESQPVSPQAQFDPLPSPPQTLSPQFSPLPASPVAPDILQPVSQQIPPEIQNPADSPTSAKKEEADMFLDSQDEGSNLFLSDSDGNKSPHKLVVVREGEADDEEGYYCHRLGEQMNGGRYTVVGLFGKGVFSTVLRAKDKDGNEVAIKVLRNNDLMKRTGMKEIQTLKELAEIDRKYSSIVSLLDNFEENGHLCLVFEPMPGGNLRDVLKKYGSGVGLNIKAVKLYAHKLMLSLYGLKTAKIIHGDIKPDNILVNETKTNIKLGDFGSAFPVSENTLTPYLQSRWYRAPEIILGMPGYSHAIDMWSVGCSLYEIFTGRVMFAGNSNNAMLFDIMRVTGAIPKKHLKKGTFSGKHFDEFGNFKRVASDKTESHVKVISFNKPTRDLKEELLNSGPATPEEKRDISFFYDFLSKIFLVDPSHRLTVKEALNHPFLNNPN